MNEVLNTLRDGWITTGPKTKQFEQEFAAFVGSPQALAVNSGTAALHIALAALGIGSGDAVITTPIEDLERVVKVLRNCYRPSEIKSI